MARQNGQLADWGDSIPESVADAAEAYDAAHAAKTKAAGELNTARDNLIAAMVEMGVSRCPIRGGAKYLKLMHKDAVAYDKPRKAPDAGIDDPPPHEDVERSKDRPVGTPAVEAVAKERKRRERKADPAKGQEPTVEAGPADPPAAVAVEPAWDFRGLEIPEQWHAKLVGAGLLSGFMLVGLTVDELKERLGFSATNAHSLHGAVDRWRRTGWYTDAMAAAYEAGEAAYSSELGRDANPYAPGDCRREHWLSAWPEEAE